MRRDRAYRFRKALNTPELRGARARQCSRDVYQPQKPLLYARHEDTVNRGPHRIWTGGDSGSWLQIPVLRASR
jgi:hypothetical protein